MTIEVVKLVFGNLIVSPDRFKRYLDDPSTFGHPLLTPIEIGAFVAAFMEAKFAQTEEGKRMAIFTNALAQNIPGFDPDSD